MRPTSAVRSRGWQVRPGHGEEPGLAGGRARGKKVLTGIAVEVREPKGLGRCRWLMRRPRRCTRS